MTGHCGPPSFVARDYRKGRLDCVGSWPPSNYGAGGSIKTSRPRGGLRILPRLSRSIVAAIDESRIIGVRAGARSDHRFIGIWAVVVDGRVFARSWTQKPAGWYRTFLDDPLGTIQVGDRQAKIRAVRARGKRIRDAIERAYASKYPTPGSIKVRARFPHAASA